MKKNEFTGLIIDYLPNLVMALVAVTIFLAIALLVVACADDHTHNIFIPPDSLPEIVVCDTACFAKTDTVIKYCVRDYKDDDFTCSFDKP